jgi:GNAT superfamily N-acetyltransferase
MVSLGRQTTSNRPGNEWPPGGGVGSGILVGVSSWQAPRKPSLAEWPMLRAAINQVFRSAGGDLTQELPLFLNPANLVNLRVIVDAAASTSAEATAEGEGWPPGSGIVAHAGFLPRQAMVHGRSVRVACVGGVFVRAADRGQGLGARVLAALLAAARVESDLVLVSGARGLYLREGLRPCPPLWLFRVPAVAPGQAKIHTRDVVPGDIDDLMAMYADASVHFLRSNEDWRQLIRAGVLVDSPARFSLILRSHTPVAYVVTQRSTGAAPHDDATGATGGHPRRILECAGDPLAVVEAAPQLAEELLLPAYDTRAVACVEKAGWIRTTRQLARSAQWLTAPEDATIPWYGLNYL